MSAESISPSERLAIQFKNLVVRSAALNAASDELGKVVSELDAALKKLSLGIEAWEFVWHHVDDGTGQYSNQKVGYARVDGRWGIAISTDHGYLQEQTEHEPSKWLFNDAPRSLRVAAIEKLPDLIATLCDTADKTTTKIVETTHQAREFANVINGLNASSSTPRKK